MHEIVHVKTDPEDAVQEIRCMLHAKSNHLTNKNLSLILLEVARHVARHVCDSERAEQTVETAIDYVDQKNDPELLRALAPVNLFGNVLPDKMRRGLQFLNKSFEVAALPPTADMEEYFNVLLFGITLVLKEGNLDPGMITKFTRELLK